MWTFERFYQFKWTANNMSIFRIRTNLWPLYWHIFKTKFNISIFMVYFDPFYKKFVMCSLFITFYLWVQSFRKDTMNNASKPAAVMWISIQYKSRQSVRPQSISCCTGFAVILHHNRRGYQAPKESDPKKNFCIRRRTARKKGSGYENAPTHKTPTWKTPSQKKTEPEKKRP
jgi:hypothetical protein